MFAMAHIFGNAVCKEDMYDECQKGIHVYGCFSLYFTADMT